MRKKRTLPELGTDKVLAQILQDPKRREAFLAEPMAEPLRPCEVDGKPAFFHRWVEDAWIVPPSLMVGGHNGGNVRSTFALVEFQDGSVKKVDPEAVRFCGR
jgi:hypothetical protein